MWRSWWGYARMYSDMETGRLRSDLEKRLRNHRLGFLFLLVGLLSGVYWSSRHLYYAWAPFRNGSVRPILSGAPQVALIALVIGLSAYLRQVRSHAVELRDKIASGREWNYPMEHKYRWFTYRKLHLLDNTSLNLTLVSPLLILLFIVLTLRMLFEAVSNIKHFAQADFILSIADVVILTWAVFSFGCLAVIHFVARMRDDRIRAVSRTFEEDMRTLAEGKDAKNPPALLETSDAVMPNVASSDSIAPNGEKKIFQKFDSSQGGSGAAGLS